LFAFQPSLTPSFIYINYSAISILGISFYLTAAQKPNAMFSFLQNWQQKVEEVSMTQNWLLLTKL
jgi:hypothetical protein